MPAKNPDLHGNVPESSPVVLLLIDVINDMEFPGAGKLVKHAVPMARRLAALKKRSRKAFDGWEQFHPELSEGSHVKLAAIVVWARSS